MEHLRRLAQLSSEFGFPLDARQIDALDTFHHWLEDEAVAAGGIGPNEVPDLRERHVADALTWLQPLHQAPTSLLDLGSGVGLPGIPLAIALPQTEVTLLDRSGKRCVLLRRALRILNLENVAVWEEDVERAVGMFEVVVSRASLPPNQLLPHLRRLTERLAIIGGSAREPIDVPGYATVKIESRYLNSARWLLIMRQS